MAQTRALKYRFNGTADHSGEGSDKVEEESTVQTGQEEAVETSSAFDDGWADDDFMMDGDGRDVMDGSEAGLETDTESEGTEADADQQEADEPEGEGESYDEASETETEGSERRSDQSEAFTLRHLGEERTVDRDEVIRLAQQGMDYGRIREKWDAVKDDVPKLRMYENFLKELAEARGGDIESLIDETRTRTLIAKAEARGEKLDPAAAAAQAVRARVQQPEPAQEQAGQGQKQNDMVGKFLAVYGNTVKAEDIPKEVWDEAAATGDLLGPYQRYRNKELDAENKRLQKELEQAKQQRKNKERSTGSSRSEGSAAAKDPFDEGWEL